MSRLFIIAALLAGLADAACADTVVATRTIRSQAIISPGDITVKDLTVAGALTHAGEVIGLEARVVLYADRPIRPGDVGPAAIIERNQIVTLIYRQGGLRIAAAARALGRGGVGDVLRVMNLTSRTTVSGIVRADGTITVGPFN